MNENINNNFNKQYFTSLFIHISFLSIVPFIIYFIALIQFTSISITRLHELLELIITIVLFVLSLILPYFFNKRKSKILKNKKSPSQSLKSLINNRTHNLFVSFEDLIFYLHTLTRHTILSIFSEGN